MGNLNKVFLMGRLARDPELRYTPTGLPVAEIRIAVNRSYNDQSGERREETAFVDVVMWRKRAEVCCEYLRKGSPIFIEGRLAMDTWETPDGQKRSRLRVVADNFQFVGGPRDRSPASQDRMGPPGPADDTVEQETGGREIGSPFPGNRQEPPGIPDEEAPF